MFKPGDIVVYAFDNPQVNWKEKRYKFKVLEVKGQDLFIECMQEIHNIYWESWPQGKTLRLEAFKFKKVQQTNHLPGWL